MFPTTELQFPQDGVRLHLPDVTLVQRITGLTITATPESAHVHFNTNRPAMSILEIFYYRTGNVYEDSMPENLVGSRLELLIGPGLRHEFEVDGLPQDTRLWFRVTATSPDPSVPRAYAIGQFFTLSRTAQVWFDNLIVYRSGDSNSPGEMIFRGAAYDYATKTMFSGPFRRPAIGLGYSESISSGAKIHDPFGTTAPIQNAPPLVTLWVEGSDDDRYDIPLPLTGLNITGEALPKDSIPGVGHGEEEYKVWASAADDVALPATVGDFTLPFKLDSGNWGVAWVMFGRIIGNVSSRNISLPPPLVWTAVHSTPAMSVDAPVTRSTVTRPFLIGGWAIDRDAPSGTGVDAVHIYAYRDGDPSQGQFIGWALLGFSRPDVAAAFGNAQFTQSGFNLWMSDSTLTPGNYRFDVYAHSTVVNTFALGRSFEVTVV